MRVRELLWNPPVLLGVLTAIAVILAVGRAHSRAQIEPPPPVLKQFAGAIDRQFHDCVPLGWFPDSYPWRGYVPSYNADVADKGALFQALWVGEMPAPPLRDARAVAVKDVLDEFTRLGLLERHEQPDKLRYNLTHDGEQYYYESNRLGNNVEWWPYLCYSRPHATNVAWSSHPTKPASEYDDITARVRFSWKRSPDAAWATAFVKAHAVELNPISSPAEATAREDYSGQWRLSKLDFAFPLVTDRAAWTK